MKRRIALVTILNLLLYVDQTTASLRVIFDRVEAQEVSKESKVQVLACHVSSFNHSFFHGELQVLQDLDSTKLKLSIDVLKCFVAEAPDTCEFLIKLKPPNTCLLINAENMAWSSIADSFVPKLRCPFNKGIYISDKVTFDASKWTIFPLDKWYFKVNIKMYEGDVLTLALVMDVHYIRVNTNRKNIFT